MWMEIEICTYARVILAGYVAIQALNKIQENISNIAKRKCKLDCISKSLCQITYRQRTVGNSNSVKQRVGWNIQREADQAWQDLCNDIVSVVATAAVCFKFVT